METHPTVYWFSWHGKIEAKIPKAMARLNMSDQFLQTGQLQQLVQASLDRAQASFFRLKRTHTYLTIAGIITSAATTLVAGITAAQGPVVGSGIPGWRLACVVAAILSFIATVSMGVAQQLKFEDRLPKSQDCLGRLRALQIALVSGQQETPELVQEYQKIVIEFADVVG